MVDEYFKDPRSVHITVNGKNSTSSSSYEELCSENAKVYAAETELISKDLSSDLSSPQSMSVFSIHLLNAYLIMAMFEILYNS